MYILLIWSKLLSIVVTLATKCALPSLFWSISVYRLERGFSIQSRCLIVLGELLLIVLRDMLFSIEVIRSILILLINTLHLLLWMRWMNGLDRGRILHTGGILYFLVYLLRCHGRDPRYKLDGSLLFLMLLDLFIHILRCTLLLNGNIVSPLTALQSLKTHRLRVFCQA